MRPTRCTGTPPSASSNSARVIVGCGYPSSATTATTCSDSSNPRTYPGGSARNAASRAATTASFVGSHPRCFAIQRRSARPNIVVSVSSSTNEARSWFAWLEEISAVPRNMQRVSNAFGSRSSRSWLRNGWQCASTTSAPVRSTLHGSFSFLGISCDPVRTATAGGGSARRRRAPRIARSHHASSRGTSRTGNPPSRRGSPTSRRASRPLPTATRAAARTPRAARTSSESSVGSSSVDGGRRPPTSSPCRARGQHAPRSRGRGSPCRRRA